MGAWHWDATLGIGFATEIDEVEALSAYRDIQITIGQLAIFIFFLVVTGVTLQYRFQNRALNAVTRSETFLRVVLDNTLDCIITIDKQGIVQSYNESAQSLFGYSAGEVIGQNVSMLAASPTGRFMTATLAIT